MTTENSAPVPTPQKCKYELCMSPAISPVPTAVAVNDLCTYHREQAQFIMWLFSKMRVGVRVEAPQNPAGAASKLVVPGMPKIMPHKAELN